MIPFSKQSINKDDINSVIKVLKSNYLTQGPKTLEFEKKISKFVNSKYAVSSNSGSSSLHLACLALGVSKNDIVWTVPNTFVASANCAINCGAKIDFVDIDPETWNIDVIKLEKKLSSLKKVNLPKVLITVHFAGQPPEQKKIYELSKKFSFKIIEDASHAIGSKHYNEKVGSCKWSDITVFSFHPTKIITTGEGGISTTNDIKLARKMKLYRTNGITKNSKLFLNRGKLKPWYYEHQTSGFNYRMNDISAVLGISQLRRINKFINRRNLIAKYYAKLFKKLPVNFQKINKYNISSYHLLIIKLDLEKFKFGYRKIFLKLRSKNFFVNLHYMPLHLSPYFKKKGFKKRNFPVSEDFSDSALSLPIYYELKLKKINEIYKIIKSFVK